MFQKSFWLFLLYFPHHSFSASFTISSFSFLSQNMNVPQVFGPWFLLPLLFFFYQQSIKVLLPELLICLLLSEICCQPDHYYCLLHNPSLDYPASRKTPPSFLQSLSVLLFEFYFKQCSSLSLLLPPISSMLGFLCYTEWTASESEMPILEILDLCWGLFTGYSVTPEAIGTYCRINMPSRSHHFKSIVANI